jgi:stage V sporulation protein R
MIDDMANHAARIRRYMERHGVEEVESFIDTCLSLENLIDIHSPYIQRRRPKARDVEQKEREEAEPKKPHRIAARSYMDSFINPPELLEEQQKKLTKEHEERIGKIPAEPERDVLAFLLEHAPLKSWERNVLEIIRDEAYYFAPQGMTKFMNEGWATYWHSRIMTEKALDDAQVIDYAEVTSGVTAASQNQLNPYRIGLALFRDIEERWNKGRFGKKWRECEDMDEKANWDRNLGLGQQKIFEVRRAYNDVTFIDEFFTADFCRRNKFFNFGYNDRRDVWEIETREFGKIKKRLLSMLTNFGQPIIYAQDGNYRNRGELLLRHRHEGAELKADEAHATLESLHRIWHRPVHIETVRDEKRITLSYDGSSHSESSEGSEEPQD